jgi:hypothetical protein
MRFLGHHENCGCAEDVKASDLFHKAKKKPEKVYNKESHVIYNNRTGNKGSKSLAGKCMEAVCLGGEI